MSANAYILANAAAARGHAETMAEIHEHNKTKKDRAAWRAYAVNLKGTISAMRIVEDDLIAALQAADPGNPLASREAIDSLAKQHFDEKPFSEMFAAADERHKKYL